jgi:hypothetical protein
MFRLSLAIAVWIAAALAAGAQQNPVVAARQAGLYGIEPQFQGPASNGLAREVWERFGIYLLEHRNRAYVAGLRPGGPAALQGAKVGDVLRGSDLMGASASLQGTMRGFERALEGDGDGRAILLYVYDADSQWAREYRLVPVSADGTVARVPPALRGAATSHPGLMAVLAGDPDGADPSAVTRDALLALQAISLHVKGCHGPDAVTIPVRIERTTETRDGLGVYRGSETDTFAETLRVRPEFAAWARANTASYPLAAVSTVRSAVLDLIRQEGCAGEGFVQLEDGLAAVIGVALERAPGASSPAEPGGFGDADAWISECYALFLQDQRAQGKNPSERGTASICLCQEHAARASGDPQLHETIRLRDYGYWEANPQLHERFTADFDQCYRAPEGSDFDARHRALWRSLGI